MNKQEFDKLTNEQKNTVMLEYLKEKINMFITATTTLNKDNSEFKANAVSKMLFIKVKEIAKKENKKFSEVAKKMIENGFENYKENVNDYVSYFLKAIDYKPSVEIKQDRALQAWNSVQELLPYMKDTTQYLSEDDVLISTLAKIGIKRIMSMQQAVDMFTNKINSFDLSELKKTFINYYLDFLKNGNLLKLESGGANIKMIGGDNSTKQLLLGPKTSSNLSNFEKDVNNVTRKIMEQI